MGDAAIAQIDAVVKEQAVLAGNREVISGGHEVSDQRSQADSC
jgi:hypothetical protein